MASALASLTAQYTDSEGEEEKGSDLDENSMDIVPSLGDRLNSENGVNTPGSGNSLRSNRSTPKRAQLVSYHDPDAGLSDEEREPVPMELESDEDDKNSLSEANGESEEKREVEEKSHIMEELWAEGVKLPPEPSGQCSRDLQEKIEKMWKRKQEEGTDFNAMIQNKKAFRNPSIYEKLILHLNIDELGTNFPPQLYDGHLFGKESYYDELGKAQKAEMDRREKALEQKKKSGELKPKDIPVVPQRKSKWDQGGGGLGGAKPGLVVPVLASKQVIPAFGSLKKK